MRKQAPAPKPEETPDDSRSLETQKEVLLEELKAVRTESLAYLAAQNQVLWIGSALLLGQLAVVGTLVNSDNISHAWHWVSLAAGTSSCLTGFALTSYNRTIAHLADFEVSKIRPELEKLTDQPIPTWTKYRHSLNRSARLRTEVAPSPYGIFLFAAFLSLVAFVGFVLFRNLQVGALPWLNSFIGMPPLADPSKAYDPPYIYHWFAWLGLLGMAVGLAVQGQQLRALNQGLKYSPAKEATATVKPTSPVINAHEETSVSTVAIGQTLNT